MTKVKICGITDESQALSVAEMGADLIGLIFARRSPRYLSLSQAKKIRKALREKTQVVGVFAESGAEEIAEIAKELQLDFVQLHGLDARAAYHALPESLPRIYALSYNESPPEGFNPDRDLLLFDGEKNEGFVPPKCRYFLAGGLTPEGVGQFIENYQPYGVDVARGVEESPGKKDLAKVREFLKQAKPGRFGAFGGSYVPELLCQPLGCLTQGYEEIASSREFQDELKAILRNYAGRPTPITEVANFARAIGGPRIFLKREDLLHTGAHKINNAIGQCLLAKKMGKTRIIAETGAGQHGVATATACALFGLDCVVYMGEIDAARQAPNVARMKLLGAKVVLVSGGSKTLKDAVNEALRDWAESFETTHYCIGSALGPHPFPSMALQFQSVIGEEAKEQFAARMGRNPDLAIACVGGGSNAIGLFSAYLDAETKLVGVEAYGAARFANGTPGALHGSYSYVLQDSEGQIGDTYSISAGLDYPGVGPQHAALFISGRVHYDTANDEEALSAFRLLSKTEGIIPALESSHALAYAMRVAKTLPPDGTILINLSGRGDKDLPELFSRGFFDEQI